MVNIYHCENLNLTLNGSRGRHDFLNQSYTAMTVAGFKVSIAKSEDRRFSLNLL